MNDEIGRVLLAERGRLEGEAPPPNFAALQHAITARAEQRLLATVRLAVGIAVLLLAAVIVWAAFAGAAVAAAAGLAVVIVWILSDMSLYVGPARPPALARA